MARHIFVVGASSGIGAACADKFLSVGETVTRVARNMPENHRGEERCNSISADMTKESEVISAIKTAEDAFGPISTVVYSVGYIDEEQPITQLSYDRVLRSFATNFGSAFLLAKHTISRIAKAGERGSFTAITSVATSSPYPGIADYCAAKSALMNFVKSVALELAPSKGRANAVSPGVVRTPIFDRAPFDERTARSWHKLERIGEPAEVASLVHYLASDDAHWITGQEFTIDGGMTL